MKKHLTPEWFKRGSSSNGPPPSDDAHALEIQYGHNSAIRKVVMIFSHSTTQVVLTPEDAEDLAGHLMKEAEAARGSRQRVS